MKHLTLLISTILIIIAFFTWILFEKTKNNAEFEKLQNKKYYINLEQLKTKLKIQNSNPNIIIKLNGEELKEEKVLEMRK
jgi:predicted RND superfamily exporter protein